jgi:hypothetical protein
MNNLYRRAESILEVASAAGATSGGTAIVLDRAGSLRVMSSEGWTLRGLIQEFGAAEVYMVQRLSASITVEGWTASGQCTLSKRQPKPIYMQTLQVTPRLAA